MICPRQRVEADCSVKEAPDVNKNRKRTSFLLLQGNSPSHQQDEHHLHFVYFKADKASAELRQEIQQLWTNFGQNHVYFAPISSMQWQTMQQWWGMVVGNTGGDKYETTAREIHLVLFSASGRVTFRKVTPTATTVNEKKFWQVPQLNWHVSSPIWAFFALSDPSCQWKIDSPKFFHAQRGRRISLFSWGTK